MIIEYRNLANKKITEVEKGKLKEYSEIHMDEVTGIIKKEVDYLNDIIKSIDYFIEDKEVELDILNDLLQYTDHVNIIKREMLGNNIIEHEKEYLGTKLVFKTKSLKNNQEDIICIEGIDTSTDIPIPEETEKFYFLTGGLEVLSGTYEADGSLSRIIYKPNGDENHQDWESYNRANFASLQSKISEDISYYFDATFET